MINYNDASTMYVLLHNAACEEFKAAFKGAGAKMWTMDDAHPLKERNREAIERSMGSHDRHGMSNFTQWLDPITRPLTVLDSYPSVRENPALMAKLTKSVDKICSKYRRLYRHYLAGANQDE